MSSAGTSMVRPLSEVTPCTPRRRKKEWIGKIACCLCPCSKLSSNASQPFDWPSSHFGKLRSLMENRSLVDSIY